MGNCISHIQVPQSELLAEIGLREHEIREIHASLASCLVSDHNHIDIDKFLNEYSARLKKLMKHVLNIKKTGVKTISFCQFVYRMWCFLTLQPSELGPYVFHIYDQDHTGKLTVSEVHDLLEDIHGESFKTNRVLQSVVELLLFNSKSVTHSIFAEWCAGHLVLSAPLYTVHRNLCKNICGENFWVALSVRRQSIPVQANAIYVQTLDSKYADEMFKQQLTKQLEKIENTDNASSRKFDSSSCGIPRCSCSINTDIGRFNSPRGVCDPLIAVLSDDELCMTPQLKIRSKPVSALVASPESSRSNARRIFVSYSFSSHSIC